MGELWSRCSAKCVGQILIECADCALKISKRNSQTISWLPERESGLQMARCGKPKNMDSDIKCSTGTAPLQVSASYKTVCKKCYANKYK